MAKFDETKPYIFISYAHKDSVRVKDIMGRLRNEGYNIWYDDGIDPGSEGDENIAAHIKQCAYFIAFISKNLPLNADYVYLYANGSVCQNDKNTTAWFTDLECFDENGNMLDYNSGQYQGD